MIDPAAREGLTAMGEAVYETDPRTLAVLSAALRSSGRATRLRAVAMLARVDCSMRIEWLERATGDDDHGVRDIAVAVLAWVLPMPEPPWPRREACGREPDTDGVGLDRFGDAETQRHQWEYAVEVWRNDGLLLGVYAITTCEEDDHHARSIALGQAILSNTGNRGDRFDPEKAATFIVGKRRCARGPTRG